MTATRERLALDGARRSLLAYALLQDRNYRVGRPHRRIARAFHEVRDGRCDRLMVFAPPRHGKTRLSELLTSWWMGSDPTAQVMRISYTEGNAIDSGRKTLDLMRSEVSRAVHPDLRLRGGNPSAGRIETTAGGVVYSVGVGGAITGRGADLMIIDDPIKGEKDAQSPVARRHLHQWFESVAYTRLQPGGSIVLIQTRWHEDDLAGYLLREHRSDGWRVLRLPAIDKGGNALWPERWPLDVLMRIRAGLSPRAWNALYQQRPTSPEGSVVRHEHIRHYRGMPEGLTRLIQSWDCNFGSESKTASWNVGQVWGWRTPNAYLLDQVRVRCDFVDLLQHIADLSAKWPQAVTKLIEDAVHGKPAVNMLAGRLLGIEKVKPQGSKVARLESVAGMFGSGNVYAPHPDEQPWVRDWIEEMTTFPYAPNDDQVDATSQALRYLTGSVGSIDLNLSSMLDGLTQRSAFAD